MIKFGVFPLLLACCCAGTSWAQEKLYVQVPAVLDPSAPITNSVKNECGVELQIGNQVFQKINERFGSAIQAPNAEKLGQDRFVKLTILGVHGIGGGGWTGSKSISIRADIMQGEQVLNSVVLRRHSNGGFGGGFSGTCSIMERIAIALARDLVRWMDSAGGRNLAVKTEVQPVLELENGKPAAEIQNP